MALHVSSCLCSPEAVVTVAQLKLCNMQQNSLLQFLDLGHLPLYNDERILILKLVSFCNVAQPDPNSGHSGLCERVDCL